MAVRELTVEINGDSSGLTSELNKGSKAADSFASKTQKTFASMRDAMQGPVAAAKMVIDGLMKAAQAVDGLVMAAAASEKAMSNLNAVFKASQGVSGMTIASLNNLSDELARTTLFEDEAVTQAEAVLLTFKAIGQDVFPAATKAAADMATVMGMDLQSATVMLGKALNEPIAGIGALRRVGVQLTDSQEKQIAKFIEVNDLMSAQKVILGELTSEFGGAASAAADTATGSYQNMKKVFGEMNEEIGKLIANAGPWKQFTDQISKFIKNLSDENLLNDVTERSQKLYDLTKQGDWRFISQDEKDTRFLKQGIVTVDEYTQAIERAKKQAKIFHDTPLALKLVSVSGIKWYDEQEKANNDLAAQLALNLKEAARLEKVQAERAAKTLADTLKQTEAEKAAAVELKKKADLQKKEEAQLTKLDSTLKKYGITMEGWNALFGTDEEKVAFLEYQDALYKGWWDIGEAADSAKVAIDPVIKQLEDQIELNAAFKENEKTKNIELANTITMYAGIGKEIAGLVSTLGILDKQATSQIESVAAYAGAWGSALASASTGNWLGVVSSGVAMWKELINLLKDPAINILEKLGIDAGLTSKEKDAITANSIKTNSELEAQLANISGNKAADDARKAAADAVYAATEAQIRAENELLRIRKESAQVTVGSKGATFIAWIEKVRQQGEAVGKAFGDAIVSGMSKIDVMAKVGEMLIDGIMKQMLATGPLAQALQEMSTQMTQYMEGTPGVTLESIAANASAIFDTIQAKLTPAINAVQSVFGKSTSGGTKDDEVGSFASGTMSFSGGVAYVGEQGPERVRLPKGSQISPTGKDNKAGNVYNFNSPKALDPLTIKRDMTVLSRKLAWEGAL